MIHLFMTENRAQSAQILVLQCRFDFVEKRFSVQMEPFKHLVGLYAECKDVH